MTEYVEACPECDHWELNERRVDFDPEKRYLCKGCRAEFPEPRIRKRKPNVGGLSKYGQALVNSDPDEVGS